MRFFASLVFVLHPYYAVCVKIVILATRISGNDGVSLEADHWREVLLSMGHSVKLVAGELDRAGVLVPELHFKSPAVARLHDEVVYGGRSYRKVEKEIFTRAGELEGVLREIFNNGKHIDYLIIPNVLSLPVHFPLAVALARVIEEKKIKTIARHHDFWWERSRYLKSTMFPFFERFFPPRLPTVKHVVINSLSQKNLEKRTGIKAEIVGDCFDFNSKRGKLDNYSKHFRADFGIAKDDIIFLQATRIVPRKRIELAIDLVKKLANPKIILVIAGRAGDEAGDYEKFLIKYAKQSGIRHIFIGDKIGTRREVINGKRNYTLWSASANADFITYPTKLEGFGNQFVESVFFKKPIILTPYKVYKEDIKPLGFKAIEITSKLTRGDISRVEKHLANKSLQKEMVEKNFELGKKHFSYEYVAEKLKKLLL